MAFLTVNGVTIPVERESFNENDDHIGDIFARGISGRLMSSMSAIKRSWAFRTTPMLAASAVVMKGWLEGQGQNWAFDSGSTTNSGQGVTSGFAGTVTPNNSGGKYVGRLTVGSGSFFGTKLAAKLGIAGGWAPTQGWTLLDWRKFVAGETYAAGFHDVMFTGNVSVVRGAADNPASTNQFIDGVKDNTAKMGQCFSILDDSTSPGVSLAGKKTDNTNSAIDHDEFAFFPFEIPNGFSVDLGANVFLTQATFASALHTFRNTQAMPNLPVVAADGDAFEDAAAINVVCRVRSVKYLGGSLKGQSFKANNRVLEVQMEEF